MSIYYIFENGKKKGPLELQKLKQMVIKTTTYIWMSRLSDRTKASKISKLSDLLKELPPSLLIVTVGAWSHLCINDVIATPFVLRKGSSIIYAA